MARRAGAVRGGGATRRRDSLALRLPAWRSRMMLGLLFIAFASLSVRAFALQGGWMTRFLKDQGELRWLRNRVEPAARGTIFDRNGVPLASSVPMSEIDVRMEEFQATPANIARIAEHTGESPSQVHYRIAHGEHAVITIAHGVDPDRAKALEALGIPGVSSVREFQRQYPQGAVTAQLLGFSGSDEHGQEGMEREFDASLQGRPGMRHVLVDRMGHVIEETWERQPLPGKDLTLAIDDRIQFIAQDAVRRAAEESQARAACAIVLDARTGELLALANWPGFDPAHRARLSQDRVRDRAVTDTFEPGSTLKPFSIATALEAGVVTPSTLIDTSPGRIIVGGRAISDEHPHGTIPVDMVVAKSSNVGVTQIALKLTAQSIADTLTAVGFGQPPHAGLSGEVAGRLRPASSWKPVEQATIAYGYGISVSLLQLAHAYLAFARDGDIVPVSVRRLDAPPQGVPVFRKDTVLKMRHMLMLATSDEGTAPAARIPGYTVAGKTGTARKMQDGHYIDAHIASFAGFAPANDPRIVVAVLVDEPRGPHYHGGEAAAPVFARIAAGTLRALQVAPDDATSRIALLREGRDG